MKPRLSNIHSPFASRAQPDFLRDCSTCCETIVVRKASTPPSSDHMQAVFNRVAASSGTRTWRIPVRVVTPIFGGGVKGGLIDEVTPISAKSIRGHLRFWWRWMVGHDIAAKATAEGRDGVLEMALREAEIFGDTESSSPFDLEVADVQPNTARKFRTAPDYGFHSGDAELYALFSARNNKIPKLWGEGLVFSLAVHWLDDRRWNIRSVAVGQARRDAVKKRKLPRWVTDMKLVTNSEAQHHVRIACQAWLKFGGVGSRTRRGLGAVTPNSTDPLPVSDEKTDVSFRLPDVVVGIANDAMDAWQKSIQLMRDFRQVLPRTGLRTKQAVAWDRDTKCVFVRNLRDVAGRSTLPEPDGVRIMSGKYLKDKWHTLENAQLPGTKIHFNVHRPAGNVPLFPRAMFGLPLGFHFADGPSAMPKEARIPPVDLDPGKTVLNAVVLMRSGHQEKADRMASPLILRPVQTEDGWKAAIIDIRSGESEKISAHLVDDAKAGKVVLPRHRNVPNVPHDHIVGSLIAALPGMHGRDNIIDAFLSHAIGVRVGFRPHANWGIQ